MRIQSRSRTTIQITGKSEEKMAGSDEEMESLVLSFDKIQEEYKKRVREIHLLNGEINKRQSLQLALNSLNKENERLTKLYTESLSNLVHQVEHRTACHSLKEQLKRINDDCLINQHEHRQECATKIADLEARVRGLLLEKATDEATVNQLRQDLEAHKSHIQHLATKLNQVHLNVESKYELEIQDLKFSLKSEREDKNELSKKLQHLEKEYQSM